MGQSTHAGKMCLHKRTEIEQATSVLDYSLLIQRDLGCRRGLCSRTPTTSKIYCRSSAQESRNANNALTGAAGHPPDEEDQPIQAKAPYRARSIMSSAAGTGSTAQGGSKAAGCGEEHSSPNATRQQKARPSASSLSSKSRIVCQAV